MSAQILKHAKIRMEKSISVLKTELLKLRTDRAHPSVLEDIRVDYYGNSTALNQVANISVENSRCLTITPWEKSMSVPIKKAIMRSSLGLNPETSGVIIRVPLPDLTVVSRRRLLGSVPVATIY